MVGGLLAIICTSFLAFFLIKGFKRLYPSLDEGVLKGLYFYHLVLSLAYYLYVLYNPSDSKAYYNNTAAAADWFELYGTSTTFIRFLAYPFVHFLGFSYEALMVVFSFFGYLGFVFFYILIKELLRFRHELLGVNLVTIILFLPNLHFWSGSLGKGSVIFFGIALFFFGINKIGARVWAIILGGLIIYHVRPHIMLVMLVSTVFSFVVGSRGVAASIKFMFLAGCGIAFFFIYQDVLTLVGIDEEAALTQSFDLTHRATELSKATSGVDITNYSLPMQLFTFLFRPLFFDAPGLLGIIVSVENIFYLVMAFKLISWRGVRFILKGNFIDKTAFLSFLTVSLALAQIAGNLGLAIRQKSQVMILLLFFILRYLDQLKFEEYKRKLRRKTAAYPEKIS